MVGVKMDLAATTDRAGERFEHAPAAMAAFTWRENARESAPEPPGHLGNARGAGMQCGACGHSPPGHRTSSRGRCQVSSFQPLEEWNNRPVAPLTNWKSDHQLPMCWTFIILNKKKPRISPSGGPVDRHGRRRCPRPRDGIGCVAARRWWGTNPAPWAWLDAYMYCTTPGRPALAALVASPLPAAQ